MTFIITKLIILNFLIQICTAEAFFINIANRLVNIAKRFINIGHKLAFATSVSCAYECCEDKSKWITRDITSKLFS